jgi:hypothetical protein
MGLEVDLQCPLLVGEEIVLPIKESLLVVPQEILKGGKGYLKPMRMMLLVL